MIIFSFCSNCFREEMIQLCAHSGACSLFCRYLAWTQNNFWATQTHSYSRDFTVVLKFSDIFTFKLRAPISHKPDSRFLTESSKAAAHHQEELLGEEDPGDLLQGGLGLTSQVQDGGSQKRDAQAEAEEHAPVGESLPPVALKQRPDPLVEQLHVSSSAEVSLQRAAGVRGAASCSLTLTVWSCITPKKKKTPKCQTGK